jgi:hypothetical protein
VGDQPFRRGVELGTGSLVVFLGPPHA